jgi:hypothetical protein
MFTMLLIDDAVPPETRRMLGYRRWDHLREARALSAEIRRKRSLNGRSVAS